MPAFLRSRAAQVAEYLERCLIERTLSEPVPPFRQWSRQLGVSRETLGMALHQLERGGYLVVGKRGVRICHPRLDQANGTGRKTPFRLVRLLLFSSHFPVGRDRYEQYGLLQDSLRRNEIEMRLERCFPSRLRQIALLPPSRDVLFILASVPSRYHALFSRRHRPSVLILGETEPDTSLSFVGIDQAGAVRHAVFELSRRGCHRIILLHPDFSSVGMDRTLRGFEAACREWPKRPVVPRRVVAALRRPALLASLRSLAKEAAPGLGVIVLSPIPIGLVVTAFLQQGVRIPKEAAIVAICHAPETVELSPAPIFYPNPTREVVRVLTDAAVTYFETGRVPALRKLIAAELSTA